jgi:hypothetical protein
MVQPAQARIPEAQSMVQPAQARIPAGSFGIWSDCKMMVNAMANAYSGFFSRSSWFRMVLQISTTMMGIDLIVQINFFRRSFFFELDLSLDF